MELKRRAVRHVDRMEFDHFVKYGETAYGLTKAELRGYELELGEEGFFDSEEHSYPEDFYFDVLVDDEVAGRVILIKSDHYYQMDLMIFDSHSGKGYGTEAVRKGLDASNVLRHHEVRVFVLPSTPHLAAVSRILEENGFERAGDYYRKGQRKRYVLAKP